MVASMIPVHNAPKNFRPPTTTAIDDVETQVSLPHHGLSLEDLRLIWRPYLLLLKTFGLFYGRRPQDDRHSPFQLAWCVLWSLLWLVAVCYVCAVRLPGTATILKFDSALVFAISWCPSVIWLFQWSSSIFLLRWCCHTSNGFPRLFRLWSGIRLGSSEAVLTLNTNIRRKSRILVVLCVIVCASSAFADQYGNQLPLTALNLFRAFVSTLPFLAHLMMIIFFALISDSLSELLDRFNGSLQQWESGDGAADIRHIKTTYCQVLDVVETVDRSLRHVLGINVATYVLHSCFNTYRSISIFFVAASPDKIARDVYQILLPLTLLFAVLWSPSRVKSKASETFLAVHRISMDKMTPLARSQLLSLQNLIGGNEVGLTCFGILNINKTLFPSAVSLFLTYLLVLVQFKYSDEAKFISDLS